MIFIRQSVGKQKNCPALVILLKGIEMIFKRRFEKKTSFILAQAPNRTK
jgi:hypothetical protein